MKCWLKIESDYQQDKYAPHYGKTPQPGPTYFMSHWTYYIGGVICPSLGDATGSTKTSRNVVYIRSQFMGDKCLKRSKDVLEHGPVQGRLHRHTKLWAFYADLQESLGTFAETKATYEAMLDLRIITPQLTLNYATFLEEHRHFELAFQVKRAR